MWMVFKVTRTEHGDKSLQREFVELLQSC
jgi:hypothetical protein